MRSIYAKALWDQRRSLPAWAAALSALVLLESAMWPWMADMPDFDAYLQDFPPAMREMFSLEEMTTGQGFLNAELFSLVLPMLMVVFGITHGARMVAGEEQAGTLDLLLVTPLTTTRLLVQELAALVTGVALLGLAVLVSTLVGTAAFGLGITAGAAFSGSLAITLLGIELGAVALVAGALTGRRGVALGVASAVGLAAYVLYVAGVFVEELASWQGLTPFDQALHEGPLSPGLPATYLWLVLGTAVVGLASLPLWARRDIGART